jgi:chromosome partitioning protein
MKRITIVNFKGGVGKSLIAHQLATTMGWNIIEVDPYGSLAERLPDIVAHVGLNEPMPVLEGIEESIIFDFGGFDDKKVKEAIELSNLVIIPYIPTLESIQTTIDTVNAIKELDTPILFVANMPQKEQDIEDSSFVLKETLGFEVEIFVLPMSVALQTAINENVSIKELAQRGGIRGYAYKKAASKIDELISVIYSYLQ